MLDLILLNVRTPKERKGDLESQIGACRVGEQRMLQIWEKYGETKLRGLTRESAWITPSGWCARNCEPCLPANSRPRIGWTMTAPTDVPRKIAVKLRFDPCGVRSMWILPVPPLQVAGSVNAVRAITLSACFYVLRCLLGEDAPATAGILRPLTLDTPKGSIVDALPPAPVAGGNVETSQRIVDVLLRALAQAVPDACTRGQRRHHEQSDHRRHDPRTGEPFTYYETAAGGMGARPGLDGISGVQTHMTNSLNTPIEALEYAYPFRVRRYALS